MVRIKFLLEHSCAILISFKIVIIFNTTSADIKTKSADVILKMTTILKEMRISQLCSKSERTLYVLFFAGQQVHSHSQHYHQPFIHPVQRFWGHNSQFAKVKFGRGYWECATGWRTLHPGHHETHWPFAGTLIWR